MLPGLAIGTDPRSGPGGTPDNSPTFQRWVKTNRVSGSPEGTTDNGVQTSPYRS
jgi:hypothetical protein